MPAFRSENIPSVLKKARRWVAWSAVPMPREDDPHHISKVPMNIYTGSKASSTDPKTWASFEDAMEQIHRYSGLGFMLGDGFFGIDIDHIADDISKYKNGDESNIVYEFVHTMKSYSEYSQSGNGIHIICRGSLPPGGRRHGNVEMYDSGRFFVMTGDIASQYKKVTEGSEVVKPLHEKYIGGGRHEIPMSHPAQLNLSDEDILNAARKSKSGDRFSKLYDDGDKSDYASDSEADLALCNYLAFFAQKDPAKMDELFRGSALMRPKWDRKTKDTTYGALTIQKAIDGCENVYQAKASDPYYITIKGKKKPEKDPTYPLDDTGNAYRMKYQYGGRLLYSYTDKSWMYYDGRVWKYDNAGKPKQAVDKLLEWMKLKEDDYLMPDRNGELTAEVYDKFISKSRSSRAKEAMLKETQHLLPVMPEQFETHPDLFNTPSGILNLSTGKLEPHDPDLLMTHISIVDYSTAPKETPIWNAFIQKTFNNDDALIRYVQEAIGYSMSGYIDEQCAFFCYGEGRNGKSTFLDTIFEIMGDYACNIQPETIMVKKGANGANSDIARLKGARFVTSVEPNEGVRLNEGLLKQLTGGDVITARRLYGNEFEFRPQLKLWMGTNHMPTIRGTDLGIWRRIKIVPFTVTIKESEVNPHLKQDLRAEYAGILQWMYEGYRMWKQYGLEECAAVKAATKDYSVSMDVVKRFIEDMCVISENSAVRANDLYVSYKDWCDRMNEYKMSATAFGREMSKQFAKKRTDRGIYYYGIRVKTVV